MSNAHITEDQLKDCWNQIGVRGDHSCPLLVEHVHCRNCVVYHQAGLTILNRPLTQEEIEQNHQRLGSKAEQANLQEHSAVLFRLGKEWFGLETRQCLEIGNDISFHSMPKNRNQARLGITSLRGELFPCYSLAIILQIPAQLVPQKNCWSHVVFSQGNPRLAFPVEDIWRVIRFSQKEVQAPPTTLQIGQAYCAGVLQVQEKSVSLLDLSKILRALNRN